MLFKRWSSNQKLEIWKDIEGYKGLYRISSLGQVKSLNYNKTGKERILKSAVCGGGYLQIELSKNSKRKKYLVHRLTAQAFIPNPENKPCIDHIDTNPLNNNVKNLRWCTQKENLNNPLSKKKKQGEKNSRAKKVKCLETGEIFDCIKYACEWCGIDGSSIAKQIQGKQKSAGKHPITKEKLHWEYVD